MIKLAIRIEVGEQKRAPVRDEHRETTNSRGLHTFVDVGRHRPINKPQDANAFPRDAKNDF